MSPFFSDIFTQNSAFLHRKKRYKNKNKKIQKDFKKGLTTEKKRDIIARSSRNGKIKKVSGIITGSW